MCERLVDGFADRGEADLIADLGVPLPGAVIGPLTGIPPEGGTARLRQYSDDYMARVGPDPEVAARGRGAGRRLRRDGARPHPRSDAATPTVPTTC